MSGDHSNHAEDEWDNETLVDRMSIVEEGENEDEQLSDDSLKKNDRAGASNIPFSSSAASNTTTDLTSNDGGVMVSRHVRKNSKRLNITSSSTSFDPKRQKCQTPNRFYFDRDVSLPDFEISFLKSPGGANTPPTSTRNSRKAIIQNRVKRTSSVDSLASNVRFSETFSESDGDAHTPPNTARSRKSSLMGGVHGTPCSVTTRFSLNDPSSINHKFIFSPFTEDFSGNSSHHINNGEKNQEEMAKDFGWIMKSRSADSALAGFYSIALDFDHKKALHEEFLNSRKLKPLEIVQTENVKSSDESVSNATSNSNTFRPLPPPPPSSGTPRIKSLTAPTLPSNPERMTPSILLQNLSLN